MNRVPLFEFANGAVAQVTDDERVPLGGGEYWAYRQVTYTRKAKGTSPECTITYEVMSGQIICTRLEFASVDDNPVMARHLKALKIEDIGAEVYVQIGTFKKIGPGQWMQTHPGRAAAVTRAQELRAMPKTRNLSLLQQVVDIYAGAIGESKTERVRLVANKLSMSERQAWRYVTKAIQDGLVNG